MQIEKEALSTLSDRIARALELTGTKKADLARAINVKPQIIQYLCAGAVQASRFTFEIATVLGLNTRWLATGDGEIFITENAKHNSLKEYKKIPLLRNDQLILMAESKEPYDITENDWVLLKTKESDIFCVIMSDTSMEPQLPANAQIFFKEKTQDERKKIQAGEIIIAYLPCFHSFMIRKIITEGNKLYLSPMNKNIFKEIELPDDAIIFGEIIGCHFTINMK